MSKPKEKKKNPFESASSFELKWDFAVLSSEDRVSAEALCRQFAMRYAFAEKPFKTEVPRMARAVAAWGGTCELGE